MIDVCAVREQFPALSRRIDGREAVFFDGPAGSQVPRAVIDAMSGYLATSNANTGGFFATSYESEEWLAAGHRAAADLLGSADADCAVFGPNMTTLTFLLADALRRTWKPGDEIVVTRLEHDANFTPWIRAAADAGAEVRRVRVDPEDCTLDIDDLRSKISERTRLVAVACASNAVGTITPYREIIALAHDAGAEVFLDAVHYAPHALLDVDGWDADYLACSPYKFFGPHQGLLWGRRESLERLPVAKLQPVSDKPPQRWMPGTASHEGIVGTMAAIDYLAQLGDGRLRREKLRSAFERIGDHERALTERLLDGLSGLSKIRVRGITDRARLDERVPTVSFTHADRSPAEIARRLGRRGIFVWHGNFYAVAATTSLGVEPDGLVRIGILHYNTAEEIDRLLEELSQLER